MSTKKKFEFVLLVVVLQLVCLWFNSTAGSARHIWSQGEQQQVAVDNRTGFELWREERLDSYRKNFCTSALAYELVLSLDTGIIFPRSLATRSVEIREFLGLYPQLPAASQQFIANEALRLAFQRLLGQADWQNDKPVDSIPYLSSKAVSCVLDVLEKQRISPDPSLSSQLMSIAESNSFSSETRQQARIILRFPHDTNATKLTSLSEAMAARVESCWSQTKTEELPVKYKRYLLKWMPMTTGKDGKPCVKTWTGEDGASWSTTKVVHTIPKPEQSILRKELRDALCLYRKLNEFDKQRCAPALLETSGKLLLSNLRAPSEKLFWEVFSSIDTHWLNENHISASLCSAQSFYYQTYDLPKAKKILLKRIGMANVACGGGYTVVNLSCCLGDLYDQLGDVENSKHTYRNAKFACDELLRLKILNPKDLARDLETIEHRLQSPD